MRGLTLVAAIAVICAMAQPDDNTPRKMVNVGGNILFTAAGVQASFARFRQLATLAKKAGYLGAVCSCVSGILSAIEAYNLKDTTNGAIAVVQATGSAALVIGGLLIDAGALTAWSGVGGVVLAVAGGLLVIGTTVYSALRAQFTVPTKALFVAHIDKVAEEGTKFEKFMGFAPGLKPAYDDVREAMYKPDFWLVSLSEAGQLRAAGLHADDVRHVTQGWDEASRNDILNRPPIGHR